MPAIGSLYVGNLHPDVTELTLYEKFSEIGPIVSVRVCRNKQNGKSLGYAYVNYQKYEDAQHAMQKMNFEKISNRPIRIMWFQKDPTVLKSYSGNIFVKNLDDTIDNQSLYYIFAGFGNILSSTVATTDDNVSKGYGFVQFEDEESAENAIAKLNGMLLNGRKIIVSKFLPKEQREIAKSSGGGGGGTCFTNLYVKNFPHNLNDVGLFELFQKYGNIKSAKVMKECDGTSKCFGFVDFEKPSCAKKAVEELNGKCINGKILYVGRAQKKSEREQLKKDKNVLLSEWTTDRQIYVANLKSDVDDAALGGLFQKFGKVLRASVMVDDYGKSKNFGFVEFENPDDAQKAMSIMNGCVIGGKPLDVVIAMPKNRKNCSPELKFSR